MTDTNEEWFERAQAVIPGGVSLTTPEPSVFIAYSVPRSPEEPRR